MTLRDMLPTSAVNDAIDGLLPDAEAPTQFGLRDSGGVESSDLPQAGPSQLGPPIPFSDAVQTSFNSIPSVLEHRASIQVGRLDAWLPIAVVQDFQSTNGANVPLIRDDVGQPVSMIQEEGPVTVRVTRGDPRPAGPEFGTVLRDWPALVNLRPEADQVGLGDGYNAHVDASTKVLTMPGPVRAGAGLHRVNCTPPLGGAA